MIKIYDVKMTTGAVAKLKERSVKEIDKLSKDELKKLLLQMKIEEEIEVDEKLQYVWIKSDINPLCVLRERYDFCEIEKLGVYTSTSEETGEYIIYTGYKDFRDSYLVGDYSDVPVKYREVFAERFKQNLKNVVWYNQDNKLKREADKELKQIKLRDENGEESIEFFSSKYTTLLAEIEKYVNYNKDDYEEKGLYLGEKIYRIKNKLYFLGHAMWNGENQFFWLLEELESAGYKYFRMQKHK